MRQKFAAATIGTALTACIPGTGFAQGTADDFPARPATIIIPVSATTSVQTEFRLYSDSIRKSTGKQFLLDFKPGAGTTIGTAYVSRAKPDGYTLLAAGIQFTISPSFYKLPYNNIKDFAPVALMTKKVFMLLVHPSAPFRNVREYIAYAKSHPGELFWGTGGMGGSTHLPGELLHHMTGTKVTFVHFKGGRLVDLMAGRVHVTVGSPSATIGSIQAGKLRSLGITTIERSPALPDMPTIAEQGVPGYDFSSWSGLVVPAGTPPAIITRLNSLFTAAGKDPAVVKKLTADGAIMINSTPQQLRDLIVSETNRIGQVVKAAGIKPEGK